MAVLQRKTFPTPGKPGNRGRKRVGSRREGPDHRIWLERENRQGGARQSQHLAARSPGSVPGEQRPTSRVVPVLEVPPALPRSHRPRTVQTGLHRTPTCPREAGQTASRGGRREQGLGGPWMGDMQKCWWGWRRSLWSPGGGSSDLPSSVHTTERKRGKSQTEVRSGPFAA